MTLEAVLQSTPPFYLFDDENGGDGLGRQMIEWSNWLKGICF